MCRHLAVLKEGGYDEPTMLDDATVPGEYCQSIARSLACTMWRLHAAVFCVRIVCIRARH